MLLCGWDTHPPVVRRMYEGVVKRAPVWRLPVMYSWGELNDEGWWQEMTWDKWWRGKTGGARQCLAHSLRCPDTVIYCNMERTCCDSDSRGPINKIKWHKALLISCRESKTLLLWMTLYTSISDWSPVFTQTYALICQQRESPGQGQ